MTAAVVATPSDVPPVQAVRRPWAAWAVLGAFVLLWVLAGAAVLLNRSTAPSEEAPAAAALPPAQLRALPARVEPQQFRPVAAKDAVAINAAVPISTAPNPPASPFSLAAASAADRARSVDCLTAAIYYEAATEPLDGQRAVAQVVLNRARHPAYPNTVCGVVFEGAQRVTGCQFSFTCDGSLRRQPMASYWARARQIAEAALSGYVHAPVGWATHYHTNWVVPYWASSLVKAANVGTHIFYRWKGGWGRPPAFVRRHPGVEPAIAWRGGFGQPTREEQAAAAALEGTVPEDALARDAAARQAAADAAVEAATGNPVGSFNRAVLRRYEPIQRDKASEMIAARAGTNAALPTSSRWALTGSGSGPEQTPLGRRAESAPAPAPKAAASEAAAPAPSGAAQSISRIAPAPPEGQQP